MATTPEIDPVKMTPPYVIIGIVVVAAMLSLAIVAISIFAPSGSADSTILLLIGAMSPVLIGLLGLLVVKKVDAVSIAINGRLTQLMEESVKAARAEATVEAQRIAIIATKTQSDETSSLVKTQSDETARGG